MLTLGLGLTGMAFAFAAAALVAALLGGGDLVGAVFATLALAVTGIVQAWSVRHLEGDPRGGRFFTLTSALAGALTLTAAAQDLPTLLVGWLAASALVVGLITLGGTTPAGRTAVRRTLASFGIGDLALLVAALIALGSAGPSLRDLSTLDPATALWVGALVAIAAITRAASVPLHGWLPATLAAPTPVSAILHAGFVNAGALLLLRFAPLDAWSAPLLVAIAGGTTVVIAGSAMLTRPDIKGRLVHSTAAQMGFMLLACAIGAWALAILHVVGHALYKSSRFLAAGSALRGEPAPPIAHSASVTPAVRTVAATTGSGITVTVAVLAGSLLHAGAALIPFIAATVWVGVWVAMGGRGRFRWVLAAALTVLASVYVLLWAAVEHTYPLVPSAAVSPWAAVAVFIAAVLAGLAVSPVSRGAVRDYAYGIASGWARPPVPAPDSRTALLPEPLEYERSPR